LEGSGEEGAQVYRKMAEIARQNGTTIDVISIRYDMSTQSQILTTKNAIINHILIIRGTDCALEHVGVLSDATNGYVDIVDPLELGSKILSVLANPIIATEVTCRVVTNENLRWIPDDKTPSRNNFFSEKYAGNITVEIMTPSY
jgi:hypothetical protein